MRRPDSRTAIWLAITVVFIVACWQFFGAIESRPMHRDEARWIHRAVYIREALHPLSDYWDESTWIERGGTMDERYRLRAQPPMGSYVMGIGFLLQGKPLPEIGFWNMDQDDAWNADHGNQPSQQQVITARRTSAMAGALTVAAICFTASRITNPVGGLIAGMLLAFNPLMIHLATFAGSDAVLGLAISFAAVAAILLADRPTWPRTVLIGVAIAFGASTKLSPLGIAAPLALLGVTGCAFRWIQRRYPSASKSGPSLRLCVQLIAIPVIALATLVVSYPYLWRAPVQHLRALIDYRTLSMEIQSDLWQQIAVNNRIEALQRVGAKLGTEWTTLGRLEWSWLPGGLELAVASAGLLLLLWLVVQRGLWSPTSLAAAVLTSETAITIYGLNADWARYHLPILLLTTTCTGIVAGQLSETFSEWVVNVFGTHGTIHATDSS